MAPSRRNGEDKLPAPMASGVSGPYSSTERISAGVNIG